MHRIVTEEELDLSIRTTSIFAVLNSGSFAIIDLEILDEENNKFPIPFLSKVIYSLDRPTTAIQVIFRRQERNLYSFAFESRDSTDLEGNLIYSNTFIVDKDDMEAMIRSLISRMVPIMNSNYEEL